MSAAREKGNEITRKPCASGRKRVLSVKGVADPPSPEALPTIFFAMDLLTGANRRPATSSH